MAHLQELAALIHRSVDAVLAEYASAAVPVSDLDDTAEPLDNAAVRAAARVLESACAQLCAAVVPPQQTMLNHALW